MSITSRSPTWIGYSARLALLSCIATFVAVGTAVLIFLLMAAPMSLGALLMPSIFVLVLGIAFLLIAPVTLGVLPVTAVLMRGRPTASLLLLPLSGFVGGGMSIWIWTRLTITQPAGVAFEVFMIIGMFAGLVAGAFLGRAIYELEK